MLQINFQRVMTLNLHAKAFLPEEVRSSTSWHDNQCLHFNKNQPQMTPRVLSGTAGARAICACCRNKRDTGQVAHNADLCLYFVHVKARLFLACELRSR